MESSSNNTIELAASDADGISISRWFIAYGLMVSAVCCLLWLTADNQWSTPESWNAFGQMVARTPAVFKLTVFGIYISLCCTFMPLPTSPIVAAVATQEAAVGTGLGDTVLLVALVGAFGSTIANLHDYHIFTWLLRSNRIARVRNTKLYDVSARWFARSPFFLLMVFNVLPIPIDVVRMLATTSRYPRKRFAVANFIGRFIRYMVIAFVTFHWNLGWMAVVGLLALATVLVASKAIPAIMKKVFKPRQQGLV